MSSNPQPEALAVATAEEILRTIYGDDLRGCTVSLDSIADIVDHALKQATAQNSELLELYEKVVEAVHLLSTPPDKTKISDPAALPPLLTERLDTIHAVSSKTIETIAIVKGKKSAE